jgi:hypothetical protein
MNEPGNEIGKFYVLRETKHKITKKRIQNKILGTDRG